MKKTKFEDLEVGDEFTCFVYGLNEKENHTFLRIDEGNDAVWLSGRHKGVICHFAEGDKVRKLEQ